MYVRSYLADRLGNTLEGRDGHGQHGPRHTRHTTAIRKLQKEQADPGCRQSGADKRTAAAAG